MQTIKQIMALSDPQEIYTKLTARKKPFAESLENTEKQWDPYKHNVMDETIRKKKKIKVPTDKTDPATGKKVYKTKYVDRVRIALPIQKTIVERSVGFLFSNPVEYKMQGKIQEAQQKVYDAVMNVFHDNKMRYFDKKMARTLYRCCECAELWYFVLDENGKPTDEMRVMLLAPIFGDKLYPHWDNYGRMDGFSRKYLVYDEEGKSEVHFDVYTEQFVYKYIETGKSLVLQETPKQHGFGKIPVIYYRQDETEWHNVQPAIDRVEELISNWGDTNDYFGTPTYFFKGKLEGFADKGETGKIYQGQSESDMRVLSWDNSPESVKGEMANLFNFIFSYTQTPDISFESMKTLGNNTSGVSIRLMFTDPHMKANMKIEQFGEMMTRRYNLVQSGYVTTVATVAQSVVDSIEVEPVFSPFLPKNEVEELNMITTATGGKATLSVEEGVKLNPLVNNPEQVLEQIQKETQAAAVMDAFGQAE